MQVRPLALAALAAVLVLVAPAVPSAAHGEHETECDRRADTWQHLDLWEPELEPGQALERTLSFDGCPLEEDWRVLLRGDVDGTLAVSLRQSDDEVGSWAWSGAERFETVTLPHTDFLSLRIENTGDADAGNATARIYFDQTCLCTAKGTHLVPGPVWMNTLAEAGDAVSFNVTVAPTAHPTPPEVPETVTVRAVLPGDDDATRTWTFHPRDGAACRDGARWTGCFEYTFQAPSDGRQDVLLWLDHDGDEAWGLSVRPVIEVEGTDRGAPGPTAALALLAVAAALGRRLAP